jgi:hypothetical protein
MGQLATGGSLMLPKFDRMNNPIRDENGEIVLEEKFFPPDQRALAHILDRLDPEPNLEPQQPEIPGPADLTSAEAIAEAAKYFDLYRAGVQILIDLGCPPKGLLESSNDIETTATHPETEPEPTPPKKLTVPEAF